MSEPVAVLGAGAWGTALASVLARRGHAPTLWARDPAVVAAINQTHANPKALPEVALDPTISATTRLADLAPARFVLYALPAQIIRATLSVLAPHLAPDTPLVLCAKGLERDTGALLSEIVSETLPTARPAVLSGPSFAADVARGLPTAITLAAEDEDLANRMVDRIGIPTFRPYSSQDLIGAQIGGAVKNVLAIACGIVEGCGLGMSARAALISRGFAEMNRLGVALGARSETLAGLSGLGDLVLTCTSIMSRNMTLGVALGEGVSLSDALARSRGIAEGVHSARAVRVLSERHGVDMPISRAVSEIIEGTLSVPSAIETLLNRPFRSETR